MRNVNSVLPRPVVAVICDRIRYFEHPVHAAPETYLRALHEAAGVMPLLLPVSPEMLDLPTLLSTVDGVLLPGSPSNVAAERYCAEPLPAHTLTDEYRDETVFSLLPQVIARGIPLLAICRGFQELNVFFGGTLHRAVHERPDALDHREGDHDRPLTCWYEDRHRVALSTDGLLASLVGEQQVSVNSLHHQGVDRLGAGLRIEALAPDGLVEAFTAPASSGLVLGLQWHPEMSLGHSPLAQQIFSHFGDACRQHQQSRTSLNLSGENDNASIRAIAV
ncbi:gamma-glutamyl-gamma-aminobutyrate hydrolase family protein [Citrobacter sp. Marseille-Q6884]|uniref:gamma-glutamyl-gamma-aminobutyrate hydrolase family protein n=1 Tax=Citrobacter sp. Marseille-Q6884 TaxID=2956786 RepID=UPI0021B4A574|nr:gamma-glutamyl-gamma-aminobutyrate hydrolase family protein [Citrobacter sp. Marseille-Q6884]